MTKVVKVKDSELSCHDKQITPKKWKKAVAKYSKHLFTKFKRK